MAGIQSRTYAARWIVPRRLSRPVGVYWLAAGFVSFALWGAIIAVIVSIA